MLDANATVEWTPAYYEQADGRLAAQHGRLEHLAAPLLRAAAAVLSVRVRAPERDRLARRARGARDRRASTQLQELRRPVDRRCAHPLRVVRRGGASAIKEVGDVWLDAGIVPFSTLGWQNAEWVEDGYGDRRGPGADRRRLPDHAYWEKWFPADWVTEMREQIRLWFYSQLLHVGRRSTGRAPFRVGARLREDARRDGPRDARLVGQRDRGRRGVRADGRRRHALAVLRAAADRNLLFGYGPARRGEAAAAHVLELGLVLRRRTRTSTGFEPT